MSTKADELLAAGDLKGFLEQIRRDKQRSIEEIGDVTNGVILANRSGARWVFLLPDMTTYGMWRMQRFDERGFSGHGIYNSHDDLVEAAVTEGFTHPDPGALDRLQGTSLFQRGNYLSDLVRQINASELSHAEADRLLAEYDAQPA